MEVSVGKYPSEYFNALLHFGMARLDESNAAVDVEGCYRSPE